MAVSSETKRIAATILSALAHPFVLLPVTVMLSFSPHLQPGRLLFVLLVYAASTILPLMLVIRRKVRAGEWTDSDVSDVKNRQQFYFLTLAVIAVSLVVFALLRLPQPLIVGTAVSFALLVLGLLINLRSKISMHLIFAGYCTVILSRTSLVAGLIGLCIMGALGWSRVALRRHTVAQVLSGAALGTLGGVVLIFLVG